MEISIINCRHCHWEPQVLHCGATFPTFLNLQSPRCSTFVAYVKKFWALNKKSVSCSLQRHFMKPY